LTTAPSAHGTFRHASFKVDPSAPKLCGAAGRLDEKPHYIVIAGLIGKNCCLSIAPLTGVVELIRWGMRGNL
jgi:hypothetical protein